MLGVGWEGSDAYILAGKCEVANIAVCRQLHGSIRAVIVAQSVHSTT